MRAESLLVVRPFNNVLLGRAFEHEIRNSSPGIARVGFLVATWKETTLQGTTVETNGIIRVVVAGVSRTDAERSADSAAREVRAILERQYGIRSVPLGSAQSVSSAALHRPFWPKLGDTTPGYFPTAGRVLFPKPIISIDPGEGWMRSYSVWREPECDLTLMGQGNFNGGFINAFQFGKEITNVQSGIESRRRGAEDQQGFVASSWKEEAFATESGLHGSHISYTRQYPAPSQSGMALMIQTSHEYLVTNAQSRCTVVTYTHGVSSQERPRNSVPGGRYQEVQEMIRRTLRFE